jgi:flavin reductase (DIM6/NTAB) family NADH-FMN oxidoreductase RutF
MTEVDPDSLAAEEAYRLLTGIVVPRPVAWVTSLSTTGSANLAPFSAFTFASLSRLCWRSASGARPASTRIQRATS